MKVYREMPGDEPAPVVHRDVKPENLIRSIAEGHCTCPDGLFGICPACRCRAFLGTPPDAAARSAASPTAGRRGLRMSRPSNSARNVLVRWYRALRDLGKTSAWDLSHAETLRMFKAQRRAARRANDALWRLARQLHLEERKAGR